MYLFLTKYLEKALKMYLLYFHFILNVKISGVGQRPHCLNWLVTVSIDSHIVHVFSPELFS